MNNKPGSINSTSDTLINVQFSDVFALEDLQRLQDLFSNATGVASIITHPDGTPITQPSNFCRLCNHIIRKTKKGLANCYLSDAAIGRYNPSGAIVCPCLSGGLLDAGASITIGGKHIANWLIGQMRNDEVDEQKMLQYADVIGVDREDFRKALNEVPFMSMEQFDNVAKMLFAFANELSEKGYKNLQLKQQIAERDKAIQLLQESEQKYQIFFENVNEVFYQCDLAGIIFEISPSIKYFTGFNRDELLGTSIYNLYSDFDDSKILIHELIRNGELKDFKLKLNTKNGDVKYVSNNARLILTDDNKPNHIVGAISDITDRVRTEEVLLESEESYHSLFENMLNGFAYCQMLFEDGYPNDFIYLRVNKAFESSTGLKNVTGKKVSAVIPGIMETDKELMETYGRVALTGKPEFIETYVESMNEWFSLSIYSPKKEFFIAVFDVITKRKQYEQELIAAKDKAEESDRLKTAFLNNISHEIRTPFNGILGFLSILQDYDLSDDEREEYVGIINQSANRLMNTINDIVEMSHIQAGQIKMSPKETNIRKLTDEVFDQYNSLAESKGLKFTTHNFLPGDITTIFLDSLKLKTIVSHLIVNALKFTQAGSIDLAICKRPDFLEFSVTDTGIGISENKQKIIFERFMQSNVSNTRQIEGLGLGLSIAKAYVGMLGGELWLKSEEGKGSTFYFTIPNDVIQE